MHSVQAVCVDQNKIHEFEKPHPKQEDEDQTDLPSHGYTYMKWPFGAQRTLITRGQVHCFEDFNTPNSTLSEEEKKERIKFSNIYAMNQWKFTKSAWSNIDQDKAAVLSQEITDNTNRVSKWALQSMFAGADNMKIIFVTRQKLADNKKHQILGTSTSSTQKFINLISYEFDDAWAKVKYIVDFFEKQEDGEYLVLRDPIKSSLKVYRMEDDDGEGEGDNFGDEEE